MKSPGVVLGIDPGLATVGYGVVDLQGREPRCVAYGCIRTEAYLDLGARLRIIREDLAALIERYEPQWAAVEKLFFNRNVTTGIAVAHARGVILLGIAETGVKLAEYSPQEIKSQLLGYGRAEKHQMQSMVQRTLKLSEKPTPDDAADGLAIALCHLRQLQRNARWK